MLKEKYCRFCGTELSIKNLYDGTKEKYCEPCDHVFFPDPSPTIIAFIHKDAKILLIKGTGWKHPHWGFVAGHIQPGESAEEATRREVKEEVGLTIDNLKYVSSYAHATDRHNLMLAFEAQAHNENITISQELVEARWFDLNAALPIVPNSILTDIIKIVFPTVSIGVFFNEVDPARGSKG
jgi:NAD+ diphosphatase